MITKLIPNIDLTKTYPAIILEDKAITYEDDTIPMYIPIIMCDIPKGKPEISKIIMTGNTIFKNAQECRPKTSTTIKQQNYLVGHKEDMSVSSNFQLQSGSKAQVSFTQGKISSISFRLNPLLDV